MKKLTAAITVAVATTLFTSPPLARAQDAPPAGAPAQEDEDRGGGRGGRRGQGGNFDPAQFQQRMAERYKEQLKVTDEEWAVIQPLVQKVQEKQRETRGGFGGRGGGRGGGGQGGEGGRGGQGGPGGQRGGGGGSPESQALRTTLENENASADEIKTKLTALRDARKKAATELETAREDLRKVLTQRQEAALVLMGILE